jgi:hypothetical protein
MPSAQSLPRKKNLGRLDRDKGYRFVDRDPDLDFICDLIDKSGKTCREISQMVAKVSGGSANVSHSTIAKWLSTRTRRPQNYTITWVTYALGYKREWVTIQ